MFFSNRAYQVVLDTCQLSFVTCEPVWSNYRFNIQCKRGYFPYGCFHVIKEFVKDEPSDRAIEVKESSRLMKFKLYLRQKPLNKIQKAVENIFDTEKITRSGFESNTQHQSQEKPVVLTPWNQWFQRIICMPVLQFKHYNNFPQHLQWRSDCDRFHPQFRPPSIQSQNKENFLQKSFTDSKIYFPDADILNKN